MNARRCYHASEAHKKYKLTCEQFDQLKRDANDRCQACGGVTVGPSGRPKLTIDHDNSLGYWAVRGLLCVSCNTRLGDPRVADERLDHYLANPWYRAAGLRERPPVAIPDIPTLPRVDAEADVRHAAVKLKRLQESGEGPVRLARDELRHAVRVAIKSGMRPTDVARATGQVWTKDNVYAACFERGRRVVQGPPRAG